MLRELTVKNYALIQSLQLTFNNTFITITGETGAGKSVLIGALSMIQGKRADLATILNKEKKCIVEALFKLDNNDLIPFFEKENLDFDREIILRREISVNQKSRAFINDTPVTLAVLQEISKYLIDIHSQDDTGDIIQKSFQLNLLDALANQRQLCDDYQQNFREYKQLKNEITSLQAQDRQGQDNQSYNTYLLEELEKAQLQQDEQQPLENEIKWLSNTEQIKTNLSKVIQINNDEQMGIQSNLYEMKNLLKQVINAHPELENLTKRAESMLIEAGDLISEIEKIHERLEDDPARIDQVNNRLQLIYTLQKKHGVNSIADLLSVKDKLQRKTEDYKAIDRKINDKKQQEKKLYEKIENQAELLHKNRLKQAKFLCEEIEKTLYQLQMRETRLKINFTAVNELSPTGKDETEMVFRSHKEADFYSIKKAASGGERSRLMLAVKKITAEKQQLPTLILDEIDAGVSGKVAEKIGVLMRDMAQNMQIVAVTHIPQVAAKGNQHFIVFKDKDTKGNHTRVKELSNGERVKEIAQMISGSIISDAAEKQAKELLK